MKDILTTIIAKKAEEIALQKQMVSQTQLEQNVMDTEQRFSMREALAASSTGIIAEFKRRSPSKGWINKTAETTTIVPHYAAAGASALSILTDSSFFGGDLKDIRSVREAVNLPILRKDFIIDEYQLYQAKIIGADAVLLIAAALSVAQYMALKKEAHALGLEVLLEIHSVQELEYIDNDVEMIGVNNRNLGTFSTTVDNSFALIEELQKKLSVLPPAPHGKQPVFISESGLSDTATIQALREVGFRGFLIGESFMRSDTPGATLAQFIEQLSNAPVKCDSTHPQQDKREQVKTSCNNLQSNNKTTVSC